jgi:eukaryotic-like serine/threonine-protein kinase
MTDEDPRKAEPEGGAGPGLDAAHFVVGRRLGSGGFGVVYEAYDRRRECPVALKVLRRVDPRGIYRFKREFRALADVSHPNLVSLYELRSEEGKWFFTMELVKGVDFLSYAWSGSPHRSADAPTASIAATVTGSFDRQTPPSRDPGPQPAGAALSVAPDPDRLRRALIQLVEGLTALHRADKLHRDVKPSNVLVTPEGRVVLLDFGLITELGPEPAAEPHLVVGTPTYMSPEQALGEPVSEASDWYSVGTILYEALTGRPPFTGTFAEVVSQKDRLEPPPPSSSAPDTPGDLDRLCADLLRRDPRARPGGAEIRDRLEGPGRTPVPRPVPPRRRSAPFVGRASQLAALRGAFERVKGGDGAVVVTVAGGSGMGKSALVRHFLSGLRQERGVTVLEGRCYERESVPFKALDSLVDALSRRLELLPVATARALLPEDVLALARLFPVLSRLDAVAGAERRVLEIGHSRELRRRAFAALRGILAALAREETLALFIDDLQWGDADSAALLAEVFRLPRPPRLLFIGCYRSGEEQTSPLLRALLPLGRSPDFGAEAVELAVADLAPKEARDLASALLGGADPGSDARVDVIARESRGSPFFVDELARCAETEWGVPLYLEARAHRAGDAALADLDEVIHARVSRLPEGPRRLLEVVAVGGRPLAIPLAKRAAGVVEVEHEVLALLRGGRLIRTRRSGERDEVEAYHDRIRETVVSRLPDGRLREIHRRLARLLEAGSRADPETLAVHFEGAGDLDRAAEYAIRAGKEAADALAFDRASRLFRKALDLRGPGRPDQQALRVSLADALANAGRGAEAAEAYRAAAARAGPAEAVELHRRAAQQLLISGRIGEGLDALGGVLARVGMRLAATPRRALASLVLHRAWLRLRGLGFRERAVGAVPVGEVLKIDTCWSVAEGLGLVDTIRGADFQARHLLLALRAGEPLRVARALAMEIPY